MSHLDSALATSPRSVTWARVGFQGGPGVYSEERRWRSCRRRRRSAPDVCARVRCARIARGRRAVLPVENSVGGIVREVNDLLWETLRPAHQQRGDPSGTSLPPRPRRTCRRGAFTSAGAPAVPPLPRGAPNLGGLVPRHRRCGARVLVGCQPAFLPPTCKLWMTAPIAAPINGPTK